MADNSLSLRSSEVEYTRAAVLAWQSLDTVDCKTIDSRVALMIGSVANRLAPQPLIIDCRSITRVVDHAFDALLDGDRQSVADYLAGSQRRIYFVVSEGLEAEFNSALGHAPISFNIGGGIVLIYGLDQDATIDDVTAHITAGERLLSQRTAEWVKQTYRPFGGWERLVSTPVVANGTFDVRNLLAQPAQYRWICAALSDSVAEILRRRQPVTEEATFNHLVDYALLCVSATASPLAAGIAVLLADSFVRTLTLVDLASSDIYKARAPEVQNWHEARSFILVTDFIVGGSELRVAKTLARTARSELLGAVAIGAALRSNAYRQIADVRAVVHLPSAEPDLEYRFCDEEGHQ